MCMCIQNLTSEEPLKQDDVKESSANENEEGAAAQGQDKRFIRCNFNYIICYKCACVFLVMKFSQTLTTEIVN